MNAPSRIVLALIAAATVTACRSSDRDASRAAGDTAARTDSAGGAVMPGMGGMGGMMGAAMMDSMHAHMRMMDTMRIDQMRAMMPMHRQMATNMLSRMDEDMRSRNVTATPAWTATVDSLRQDLARMPQMSGPELRTLMTAHHARMTRLMQMHRDVMGKTKR